MPASDKTPSKRVTVADLVIRLDNYMMYLTDIAGQQDKIEERQMEILERLDTAFGRLDAQRDGLMAVEERLGNTTEAVFGDTPIPAKCEHHHYTNRFEDCTTFCRCVEGLPVSECSARSRIVSMLPARVLQQDEIADDENAVDIEELMDGGNVAATEALTPNPPTREDLERKLADLFDVPHQFVGGPTTYDVTDEYLREGRERLAAAMPAAKAAATEQALLRIASRLFYLQQAEDIMESQSNNRSGWVADAWTEEVNTLWPLLYQWAREQGWL